MIPLLLLASAISLAAEKATSSSWTQKMRALDGVLQELLVDLSSDERFHNPKNFRRIEKNAQQFASLAHELKSQKEGPGAPPDRDPSIALIAQQFASEAKQAHQDLVRGQRNYARQVLRSMTGYCMACHTRNSSGPGFQTPPGQESSLFKSLEGLERANFLASTRQFDRALDEYERILASAQAAQRSFDFERAARLGLSIAVRVKKDPDRALSLVERVLAEPKAPFFLKEQAVQWKESLNQWKQESSGSAKTEEGYFSQAVRLLADAKTKQKYPADRSADILYLRASAAVHDLLSFAPDGKRATEAYYMAGLSYEVLRDLSFWDLHEFYFLACIKKSPHTPQARECFRHYQESVFNGYTGTGGTHLPGDVAQKLKDLDALSDPNASRVTGPGGLQ